MAKVLYNVTCCVNPEIGEEWLEWMRNHHIPEVMATGKFEEYRILEMIDAEQVNSVTYAIQYLASSLELYHRYQNEHAPMLQKKTLDRYGDQISAFRSLLKVIQ